MTHKLQKVLLQLTMDQLEQKIPISNFSNVFLNSKFYQKNSLVPVQIRIPEAQPTASSEAENGLHAIQAT